MWSARSWSGQGNCSFGPYSGNCLSAPVSSGLAIARESIRAQAGSFRLAPSTGSGATFQITLPVPTGPGSDRQARAASSSSTNTGALHANRSQT